MHLPYLHIRRNLLLGLMFLLPISTMAQSNVIKLVLKTKRGPKLSQVLERTITQANLSFSHQPAEKLSSLSTTINDVEVERVSLSNGKFFSNKRHSIAPSATTILGSPAIVLPEEKLIASLLKQMSELSTTEYLTPIERARWREDFVTLNKVKANIPSPTDTKLLELYLTHAVPQKTLIYLQKEYQNLITLINQTNSYLIPKIVYSFLQNEGRSFAIQERKYINEQIDKVRTKINVLAKALNKDLYLRGQMEYWNQVFLTFNPLLKGTNVKASSIFRSDNRKYVPTEFNLHYPDGTSPYLKDSHSLIEDDEDYDEDEDSWASVREKMRNPPISQEDAAKEREELLPHIPENLHVAVINDDYTPIVNLRGWCKKGYIGKNATLSEFRDGFAFMEAVRNGARYDLVITDLLVPNGGMAMMEKFRSLDDQAIVIASSKYYPDEGDEHSQKDLFNFGIDGYMWYNSNLNEGMYGYVQYLRQMKLYFDYKKQHGWQR